MPDKGGLQLLPNTRKRIEVKIPGENRFVYIGATLIALVLIAYGGLWFYGQNLQNHIDSDDSQLVALDKSRDLKAEAQLTTLSQQMSVASQIMKDHVHWSTAFSHLETDLQPSVQFESISAILTDNSIQMRAQTDNYTTIAKQIAAFAADDAVKDILLNNVTSLTSGKLDFNAKITFDPTKFLNSDLASK
ncbi:MAG TPA: hypothetical protein VFK07_00665 [Candidatus Paceibacterota bacterium]|nr:hypothetical protein [Candidatus Paceibacterota bacterium]